MPDDMQLIDYLGMCATLPMSAPACHALWETVMYACAAIGLLLAGWFIWKLIDQKRKLAAALQAQQEREKVAAPAAMRQHSWTEPADIAADVTDPHLARKIRQELEQQRLKNLRP
jgi:hypothetical protein